MGRTEAAPETSPRSSCHPITPSPHHPPRRGVVTAGVSYHDALIAPEQPLAGLEPLDIHSLAAVDLEAFGLLLVLRSVDNEKLWVRRHQFARFLDQGGVLVSFGEAWTNWFPGCRWHPEHAVDLLPPVLASHPWLDGLTPDAVHWHATGPRWCNHGHFGPPPEAEVLIANQDGGAWLYVDRATTNGVIVAGTNLDLDTHTYYGNATARELLCRVLAWAGKELAHVAARRQRAAPKIAGLFSGVNFQRGFFADREFGAGIAVAPVEELAGSDLSRFSAVWIPRESNQALLLHHRRRLETYLAGGGTLVSFDEVSRPWLRELDWKPRVVDPATLTLHHHPILDGLELEQVRWHAHGVLDPPAGAKTLIGEGGGGAILYLDERTYAPGRLLAGTLDPDCHAGYGSERTRPLLRNILRWVFSPSTGPEEAELPAVPVHESRRVASLLHASTVDPCPTG